MKKFSSKEIMAKSIERYSKDPKFTKDKFILSISGEIGAMKRYGNSNQVKELEEFRKVIRRIKRR